MEQGNQALEITRGTVETGTDDEVNNDVNKCARRGCTLAPKDDANYCDEHHEDQKRRQRECMARKREQWGADGKCPSCGGNRGAARLCARCAASAGRLGVNNRVNNHAERIKARTVVSRSESDGFQRTRYHGGKKGAPSIDAQDEFERKIIKRGIERYLDACTWLAGDGKTASKDERDAARLAALGQLDLATRAADDILDRNRYQQKRDAAHQRAIAARGREIVKSGR